MSIPDDASNRIVLQKVRKVFVDDRRMFEVVEGTIIRCRRFGHGAKPVFTSWTDNDSALVKHALEAVKNCDARTEAATVGIEVVFQGRRHKVHVSYFASPKWVLRRLNGTVYQIHPEYAGAFARENFLKLKRKEG